MCDSHTPNQSKIVLVYGASGWIGSQIVALLNQKEYFSDTNIIVVQGTARIDYKNQLEQEFNKLHQPPRSQIIRVINCAGKTGRPNVDWCELNKDETLQTNLIGALHVASLCQKLDIHLTYFGTGCMFTYNEEFPMPTTEYNPTEHSCYPAVKETDPISFRGSFYSQSKASAEEYIKQYPKCLILRLRMPISDDLHPRSLLTKLLQYKKVVNIPNSMSVLHDLLPIAVDMCYKEKTGIYNFTNPGYVTHNQLLRKYKEYIDPTFEWENFSEEEQSKILLAPRSNTFLDTTKLSSEYKSLLPITTSLDLLFSRMKNSGKAQMVTMTE